MRDLYLIDSSTLISVQSTYYSKERVPEFWNWLLYHARADRCKIVDIIFREITPRDEEFKQWLKENERHLILDWEPHASLVTRVVSEGYADDLTEVELEKIGNDPFLIACALQDKSRRCVVTNEVSRPSRMRGNRKIPDVCRQFDVACIDAVGLIKALDFRTNWDS